MRRLAFACLLALAVLGPAAATSAAPRHPPPSQSRAVAALERVEALRAGRGSRTGRELSAALNQLTAALPALSGADREAAERLLARPTDGASDPQQDGYRPASVIETKGTDHFLIHYVKAPGGDPDRTAIADVDAIAAVLEQAHAAQTVTLGWRPPPPDGALGGDGRTDVYLKNLLDRGIFGYVAVDPGQPGGSSVPHFSYMVLDNGFTEIGAAAREAAIQATVAHELNHVLQNGYDYLQDTWMFESTAVWMEEAVFGAADDYLRYMASWVNLTDVPLAEFRYDPATGAPDDESVKAYGSGVWNHWLSRRWSPDAVRGAWARSPETGDFAPAAYDAELAARGAGGFAEEFERFAAATAEWRAPGNGFPDLYPDIPRAASVSPDGSSFDLTMDHTTFRHLDVPLNGQAPALIQLTGAFPPGTPGAVALVGRTGGDTDGGVETHLARAPAGGVVRVRMDQPARFARVTAVVVNPDAAQLGFDAGTGDWIFRDGQPVRATMDSGGPPSGATGDVSDLADKSATLTASLAANVLDTSWRFEYGESGEYLSSVAAEPQPLQGGNAAVPVSARLEQLRPATAYHYRVVAENALGRFEGAERVFITERDVTPPVLAVRAPKRPRRRAFTARVRCDERCRVTASVVLGRRAARRLGVRRTIARGRVVAPEGVTRRMIVRMPRRTARKLAGRRILRATATWRAVDEFGNRARVSRKLRLRR